MSSIATIDRTTKYTIIIIEREVQLLLKYIIQMTHCQVAMFDVTIMGYCD